MDQKLYTKLVKLQETLWRSGDLLHQDDLFTAQSLLSKLLLDHSNQKQEDGLVEKFPYLYKRK